jgi:hypothetical protein
MMKNLRRTTLVAVSSLVTVASMATAASAMTSVRAKDGATASGCTASYYCVYPDTGFTGSAAILSGDVPNWGKLGLSRAESFDNNTNEYVRLYHLPDYKGAYVCADPGIAITSLAGYDFNSGSELSEYGQPVSNNVQSSTENSSPCGSPF